MDKITILALDPASHKTGWAIYRNGRITDHGVITLKGVGETSSERTDNRIIDLKNKVCKLIEKHKVAQVVSEDVFRDGDIKHDVASMVLSMCRAAVTIANNDCGLPKIIRYNPQYVKATVWGYSASKRVCKNMTRQRQKEMMCKAVKELGYILNTTKGGTASDDEADAIGVLITHLRDKKLPITHPCN